MKTNSADWWRRSVISFPLPIPKGFMVGMQDRVINGQRFIVEFLEKVPPYRPNPNFKEEE